MEKIRQVVPPWFSTHHFNFDNAAAAIVDSCSSLSDPYFAVNAVYTPSYDAQSYDDEHKIEFWVCARLGKVGIHRKACRDKQRAFKYRNRISVTDYWLHKKSNESRANNKCPKP